MESLRLRHALAAIGFISGLAASGELLASPIERTVDTTGLIGAVGLQYGDHTVNSALATALEVDSYTFAAAAGDQLRLNLHTLTTGVDASLILRGPTGTVATSTACNGHTGIGGAATLCSLGLDYTISSAGTYTVNVSDAGSDNAGTYQLHLDRYPPLNNWVGFGYNSPTITELGHSTDIDFFAFNGVANTGARLTVATTTAGIDSVLEVWDPSGSRISQTFCNGHTGIGGAPTLCTNSVDLNLASTGVYKVGIYDSGLDNTGGYNMQVNCLFGNCPLPGAAVPVPVPEPSSYLMALLGLGVVLGAARRRRAGGPA